MLVREGVGGQGGGVVLSARGVRVVQMRVMGGRMAGGSEGVVVVGRIALLDLHGGGGEQVDAVESGVVLSRGAAGSA